MIVPCECGAKLRIDETRVADSGTKIRCPRCSTVLVARKQSSTPKEHAPPPPSSAAPAPQPVRAPARPPRESLVLVAHESEEARTMICNLLTDAGFTIDTATNGAEALKKATEGKPQVLLVDVGLPGIYGFELCERLKDDEETRAIRVILLTSVYDVSRYKRTPVSLYGADDYIEKHTIPEQLILKIQRLLHPDQYAEQPSQAIAQPAEDLAAASPKETSQYEFSPGSLLQDEEANIALSQGSEPGGAASGAEPSSWLDTFIQQAQDGVAMAPDSFTLESSIFEKNDGAVSQVKASDPEAVEKAKRFARIIVSDIAIYNQEAVQEGIRNGTFYELLNDDIEEGRQLYENRVPEAIRSKKDFYQEAFDNFIEAQKRIVR